MASKNNKKFVIELIVLVFFAIIVGITALYNTDTNTLLPSLSLLSYDTDTIKTYKEGH